MDLRATPWQRGNMFPSYEVKVDQCVPSCPRQYIHKVYRLYSDASQKMLMHGGHMSVEASSEETKERIRQQNTDEL